MIFPERFSPWTRVARIRDERVAGHVVQHFGELDPVREWQEEPQDVGSPDDRNRLAAGELQGLFNVMGDLGSVGLPAAVTRQHDVTATGQQPRKAVERLATHHHRASHRQRLEPLEVGGKMPGQFAIAPDYTVLRTSNDEGDRGPCHTRHLGAVAPRCQAG